MSTSQSIASTALSELTINYFSFSSLTFVAWDIMTTFDDEVQYIWPQPRRSPTKWLFLFTRYHSLLCQLVVFLRSLGRISVSSYGACLSWTLFQTTSLQCLVMSVELLLAIRVYALHGRSWRIRVLFSILFGFEVVAAIVAFSIVIPHYCASATARLGLLFLILLSSISMVTQVTVFVLALAKSLKVISATRGTYPILYIVARDSLWVFVLITGAIVFEGICFGALSPLFRSFLYSWGISVLSFSSCRLVLNLCRLKEDGPEGLNVDPAFTTNLDEIVLDELEPGGGCSSHGVDGRS
ncbi:hypothetical protein JAAARDRAFT_210381 [Jaapia argillacea MUCL 33604]|uniref:DUF6533 domain-containing protein n=1 Tax=Jaapia argillacea MUCL 33604 TaxID=933084 RepID=A0A067PCN1_9AGAM|nr:hypothetical protein JAAARDRAFT_210381 [Jaapia argillacea MUCL 33604]